MQTEEQYNLPPVSNFSEESLKKIKENPNFQSYAYINLLNVLLEQGDPAVILAKARVYGNMLRSDKTENKTVTKSKI